LNKKLVKIRYQNGINKQIAETEILNELADKFDLIESDEPDFVLFGPYGNDIPAKSDRYTRIAYYCENFTPDMSACEWAFGVPREEEINHPRYKRIQWHGFDPAKLVKPFDYDPEKILRGKKHFCNFLYSHRVPYREEFFRQLSKYKKVDAPGKSMNNMESIDELYTGNIWERKRQFLAEYKFTIAFENYVYPGYQTEKLYDAMQANSIPVYCGDPNVGEIFNTASFINVSELVEPNNSPRVKWLQRISQPDFKDMRPAFYHNPAQRLKRKLRLTGRELKMKWQFRNLDFSPVIERIIELDKDDSKYLEMLSRPWFNGNKPPSGVSTKDRWMEIFESNIGKEKA
jgi:hypothetical protein